MATKKRITSTASRAEGFAAELRRLIETIDRPMTVCSCGECPLILLGLHVEGAGSIGLPLGEHQAIEVYEQDLKFLADVERIRKARGQKAIPSTRGK